MGLIKTWAASAKWVFWLLLGVAGVVLVFVFKGLFTKAPLQNGNVDALIPHVPKFIQERVRAAEDNALTVKATTKAKTEAQQKELGEITKIDDGAERRKRLAAFLKTV
jgi:hypothetical protein